MTHCKLCGRTIDLPGRRMYCSVCAAYMKKQNSRESDRKRYAERRKVEGYKLAIILEIDPSDHPLTSGMTIPIEEHKCMMNLQTYTPGTIIRQGDVRKRIDLVRGKMVAVRI